MFEFSPVLPVALAAGAGVGLLAWQVAGVVADTPPENRNFRDSPPWGFRLLWLPLRALAHSLNSLLSSRRKTGLGQRLQRAGLDFCLSPAEYVSGQVLYAILGAAVALWLLTAFSGAARHPSSAWLAYGQALLVGAGVGWLLVSLWLRDRLALRRQELMKFLPFYLDIITLCAEAGLNFQGAMGQAVQKGPRCALRDELQRVLRDIRAGRPRAEALRGMAARLHEASVSNFVTAVIHAETMGLNLGPVLRIQADQRRSERFLHAEKLAMEAPVKMLLPLIACIFPCTFIVLFFPIAMKLMSSGL